jgi:hypothetical protein
MWRTYVGFPPPCQPTVRPPSPRGFFVGPQWTIFAAERVAILKDGLKERDIRNVPKENKCFCIEKTF